MAALHLYPIVKISNRVAALEPSDLSLDEGYGHSKQTKTGKRRKFILTTEIVELLRRTPPKEIGWGKHKGEFRVFGYATLHGIYGPWDETCRRAGIRLARIWWLDNLYLKSCCQLSGILLCHTSCLVGYRLAW